MDKNTENQKYKSRLNQFSDDEINQIGRSAIGGNIGIKVVEGSDGSISFWTAFVDLASISASEDMMELKTERSTELGIVRSNIKVNGEYCYSQNQSLKIDDIYTIYFNILYSSGELHHLSIDRKIEVNPTIIQTRRGSIVGKTSGIIYDIIDDRIIKAYQCLSKQIDEVSQKNVELQVKNIKELYEMMHVLEKYYFEHMEFFQKSLCLKK